MQNLVTRKQATNFAVLAEKLENIRGVVIMAFPQGLPEYDSVRIAIEENSSSNMNSTPNPDYKGLVSAAGLEGSAAGVEILDPETAELWIASRCLDRREKFCERYGRNEKTKLIAKMQKLEATWKDVFLPKITLVGKPLKNGYFVELHGGVLMGLSRQQIVLRFMQPCFCIPLPMDMQWCTLILSI